MIWAFLSRGCSFSLLTPPGYGHRDCTVFSFGEVEYGCVCVDPGRGRGVLGPVAVNHHCGLWLFDDWTGILAWRSEMGLD